MHDTRDANEIIHKWMHPEWCSHEWEQVSNRPRTDRRDDLCDTSIIIPSRRGPWKCTQCFKTVILIDDANHLPFNNPAPSYASFDRLLAPNGPVASLLRLEPGFRAVWRMSTSAHGWPLLDHLLNMRIKELVGREDGPTALRDEVAEIIEEMKRE